jgi:hypothetical protein
MLHTCDMHRVQSLFFFDQMTAAFRVNKRVKEILGITVKLNIISEATNFITWILASLACNGSFFIKILN